MTLMRWTPWQELEGMQRTLGRLLDETGAPSTAEFGTWLPPVDIKETDDALLVHAEVPGIDKKDVKVDVHDGVLTISGERQYQKDVKEKNMHRSERAYGRFSRSFSLPFTVDADNVDATMKDGVLEVRLPKSESAKPRSIEIR
ncbi:MAG TPA: Hsp20/alpha crystallin family protein [Mariprofundaceae bacterium]|nr:Hsp20/alpha crystallin family protein [Mariprofundaceae bacterium]